MLSQFYVFSIKVIKITSNVDSTEIRVDLGDFVLNKLCFNCKKCLRFYQFLVVL